MDFSAQVAVVTGGGSGIGEVICTMLARRGAMVGVVDVDQKGMARTVSTIEEEGGKAMALPCDVSSQTEVAAAVGLAVNRFGPVDILVNNAGIGGATTLVHEIPEITWDRVMAVNLKAAFLTCRAVLPVMKEHHRGKILNVASFAARKISFTAGADYTASKYGLIGFSKHLAYEVARYGINVNVICPGATLTSMTESGLDPVVRESVARSIPLGRWATPEDQAEAALFLLSDNASMITGAVLDVEGGILLGFGDYPSDMARRDRRTSSMVADRQRSKSVS
jgi:NAD(P)-dependent dehydrogenase (short-subunit alcohol dehydrogenase family)